MDLNPISRYLSLNFFGIAWIQFHFLTFNFFSFFYPFDILPFFIQRLRLEVNFLTSNLNPLNGIALMQYSDLNPFRY